MLRTNMSLTTGNIFAALDTKKGKKKKSKEHDKKKKSGDKKAVSAAELERAIFSQPSISISNWADEDDDDEFVATDTFATNWTQSNQPTANEPAANDEAAEAEDSEEEVDLEKELGVELGHDEDDELEDDREEEQLPPLSTAAPQLQTKLAQEPERQLSKKELKKKELEELDAVFAELGIEAPAAGAECKEANGVLEKKKKKKKKDGREIGEAEDGEAGGDTSQSAPSQAAASQAAENKGMEDVEGPVELEDPAKVKARLAAQKKKSDAAKKKISAAAVQEAKIRAKKLNKQKDTSHYNQQVPTR